jgi:hypothetical protein
MYNHNFEKAILGTIKPHTIVENVYYVCFFFDGEWEYTKFYANQIANEALCKTIGDARFDEEIFPKTQYFSHRFKRDGQEYVVTFSYDSVEYFNIYTVDDEDENLKEGNVPYQVIKVVNNGKDLYKLSELV